MRCDTNMAQVHLSFKRWKYKQWKVQYKTQKRAIMTILTML